MQNQDVFSLCMDDMAASLELVSELENELGNVRRKSGEPKATVDNETKKRPEPRAWAAV